MLDMFIRAAARQYLVNFDGTEANRGSVFYQWQLYKYAMLVVFTKTGELITY